MKMKKVICSLTALALCGAFSVVAFALKNDSNSTVDDNGVKWEIQKVYTQYEDLTDGLKDAMSKVDCELVSYTEIWVKVEPNVSENAD